MFKKILIVLLLFLFVGIGCAGLVNKDNLNSSLQSQLEVQEKTYSGRIDSLTAYQENLVEKINELNEKNQKLLVNYNALQSSYNELEATYNQCIDDNEQNIYQLDVKIADLKGTIAELEQQVDSTASENTDLKTQVADLKLKVSELEKSIADKNASIEQLNSTIQSQKNTIDNLNATIADLNSTITELTNDLNSDLMQLDAYKGLIDGTITTLTAGDFKGVTEIRSYAFSCCYFLESVTLPDSITLIRQGAFSDCSSLTTVQLPSGLTRISDSLFARCRKLENIVIPDSVTQIDSSAFRYCTSLKTATLPVGVEKVGKNVYSNCTRLECVEILSSKINSFMYPVFENCTNLTTAKLRCVPSSSFREVSSLRSVILLDGVESIGSQAFYKCPSLETIAIPSSVTNILSSAFAYSGLRNISFNADSQLRGIWSDAFRICKLSSIALPAKLTSLATYAFSGCSNLTTVTIPSSVAKIGQYVFQGTPFLSNLQDESNGIYTCSDGKKMVICVPTSATSVDLTDVYLIADSAFSCCTALTTVSIPSSVVYVGTYLFNESSLETLIININVLPDNVFNGSSSLTSVYVNVETPPTCSSSAFNSCSSLTTIYVPTASVNAYKTASVWSTYADKIIGYDFDTEAA